MTGKRSALGSELQSALIAERRAKNDELARMALSNRTKTKQWRAALEPGPGSFDQDDKPHTRSAIISDAFVMSETRMARPQTPPTSH